MWVSSGVVGFTSFAFFRAGWEQILNILCLLWNEGGPSCRLCASLFCVFQTVERRASEKIQHVDSLLACELKGDIKLL